MAVKQTRNKGHLWHMGLLYKACFKLISSSYIVPMLELADRAFPPKKDSNSTDMLGQPNKHEIEEILD